MPHRCGFFNLQQVPDKRAKELDVKPFELQDQFSGPVGEFVPTQRMAVERVRKLI